MHEGRRAEGRFAGHTITAPSPTREYGEANPSLDGGFSGAKNGETFIVTGSTTATETSPFGTYEVIPAVTGPTLANYEIVPIAGTLTIGKATLTITAPTVSRYHGQPNPSLDGTFDGAKNGETFDVTGSTTATPASPVGDYDVIPEVTGATIANYTVVPVLGTLTVIPVCPSIEADPVSTTVCAGAPATFTVTAAGTGPLSYQWRHNGSEIPGANEPSYTITSVGAGHLGSYDVVVSAYCTPVTSVAATLALEIPTITSQPTSVSVCAGLPASFSVGASGGCVTYQWRRNGVDLVDGGAYSGATTNTLTVNTASVDVSGTFDVLVTGIASDPATLTVTPTFTATANPATIAYKLGKMRTIATSLTAGTVCQSGSYMLESITANEPISAGDIQFASYNTTPADVSFNVASRRNGASPRIYTIRYKATDALGNVSYTTTTVTVPLVGGLKPTGPEDETDAVTGVTGAAILEQNAPNPFSGSTDLRFVLPVAGATRLAVYDMKGSLVATLVDEHRDAGLHIVRWDGTLSSGALLESGTYVYRLESATGLVTRTMSIVR